MKYIGIYEVVDDLRRRLKLAGCKVVTFGDGQQYDLEKFTEVPAAHLTPISIDLDGMIKTVTFDLFVYQLKEHYKAENDAVDGYGMENTIDALDETALILDKFVPPIKERTIELGEGGYYRVRVSSNFSAALVEGNSNLTGWQGTLNLTIHGNVSRCADS